MECYLCGEEINDKDEYFRLVDSNFYCKYCFKGTLLQYINEIERDEFVLEVRVK